MDDMTNEERPPMNCRLLVTAAGSVVTCHRTGSPCSAMCPHMNIRDGGGLFSCADPELESSPVLMVYNDDLAHPWKAPRFAESHQCCAGHGPDARRRLCVGFGRGCGGDCSSHCEKQRTLASGVVAQRCSERHVMSSFTVWVVLLATRLEAFVQPFL